MAYNVWKARTDPALDHVLVVQEKGQTRQLGVPSADA
jgi:hypothetical protein